MSTSNLEAEVDAGKTPAKNAPVADRDYKFTFVETPSSFVSAITLSLVFYHRQVVSHARQTPPTFSEMARLLAYLFLPPALDTS
ncbi:MAG: hypothetical protein WAO35_16705 [Terriglobia bacterium]